MIGRRCSLAVLLISCGGVSWAAGCAEVAPATGADAGDDVGAAADAGVSPWVLDCVARRNWADPRCLPGSEVAEGSIGSGPTVFAPSGAIVEGDTLIVAAYHALIAVDLRTGDRTLRSGTFYDARTGEVSVGEGPELVQPADIRRLPDGAWAVYDGEVIYRVDPSTGDRQIDRDFESCQAAPFGAQNVGFGIELDDAGAVYATGESWDTGIGIFAIDSSGACSVVSWSALPGASEVGSGPAYTDEDYRAIRLHDGAFYVTGDDSLYRTDPITGDRERISSSRFGLGIGPALPQWPVSIGVRSPARLWVCGWIGHDQVIEVDLATGDRTSVRVESGPFVEVLGPEGSVSFVVAHPHLDGAMLVGTTMSLLVVDPASNNSSTLSR
jgi:hypothetical protein